MFKYKDCYWTFISTWLFILYFTILFYIHCNSGAFCHCWF